MLFDREQVATAPTNYQCWCIINDRIYYIQCNQIEHPTASLVFIMGDPLKMWFRKWNIDKSRMKCKFLHKKYILCAKWKTFLIISQMEHKCQRPTNSSQQYKISANKYAHDEYMCTVVFVTGQRHGWKTRFGHILNLHYSTAHMKLKWFEIERRRLVSVDYKTLLIEAEMVPNFPNTQNFTIECQIIWPHSYCHLIQGVWIWISLP